MPIKNSITILLLVLLLGVLSSCQTYTFEMKGGSMDPTIKFGDIVTADLSAYNKKLPVRGDIVMFESPAKPGAKWAMRVIALPGEEVSYDSLGISINGKKIDLKKEGITYRLLPGLRDSLDRIRHPYTVPADHYYLLGDNVKEAYDSSYWGAVAKGKILGRININ